MDASPSSRRAWIEIGVDVVALCHVAVVALLAEGVDRNSEAEPEELASPVALLAEGVDRNSRREIRQPPAAVALLAEGVDRNFF